MSMQTTIIVSYKLRIHLYNGYASDGYSDVEGVAIIQKNDGKPLLPEETILAVIQLGAVLRPIVARLKSEGFRFVDGKLVEPKENKAYELTR